MSSYSTPLYLRGWSRIIGVGVVEVLDRVVVAAEIGRRLLYRRIVVFLLDKVLLPPIIYLTVIYNTLESLFDCVLAVVSPYNYPSTVYPNVAVGLVLASDTLPPVRSYKGDVERIKYLYIRR